MMRIKSVWPRRFLWHAGGSVAVEFAILAPVIILMLACLYEFGTAFQAMTAANRLASEYAISWADCVDNPTGTCQTEMGLYTPAASIGNIAPQLTASRVGLQMFQVSMSGTTPNVTYSYPSGAALSAAQTTAAQASLTTGENGVIVTVNYTYIPAVFGGLTIPGFGNIIPTAGFPMSYTVVQLKA